MIVVFAMVIGAFWGWTSGGRRGGTRLDRLHLAAAFAIAFAIVGMFATILLERSL
jgi:hypothetical protein